MMDFENVVMSELTNIGKCVHAGRVTSCGLASFFFGGGASNLTVI